MSKQYFTLFPATPKEIVWKVPILIFLIFNILFSYLNYNSHFNVPVLFANLRTDIKKNQTRFKGLTLAIGTIGSHVSRIQYHLRKLNKSNFNLFHPIHFVITSDSKLNAPVPVLQVSEADALYGSRLLNPKYVNGRHIAIGMSLSFKISMEYFLKYTHDSWYFHAEDDGGYYYPNLLKALDLLNKLYPTPNKTPLIFGCPVTVYGLSYPFLGGGSGYIFSRKGTEMFLENFEHFLNSQTAAIDVHMNQILELFNMSFQDSFFPGMTSGFDQHYYPMAKTANFPNTLPKCTSMSNKSSLSPSLLHAPINSIFSFHHFWDFDKSNTTWEEILEKNISDDIHYFNCNWPCHVCRDS